MNRYYVYVHSIADVDTPVLDGKIIYVGKGYGTRVTHSERIPDIIMRSKKLNYPINVEEAYNKKLVKQQIIFYNLTSDEAHDVECALVRLYGLYHNHNGGTLLNANPPESTARYPDKTNILSTIKTKYPHIRYCGRQTNSEITRQVYTHWKKYQSN